MAQLLYPVPQEADGQRLGVFLRASGLTAGFIKSVKYRGTGFFADGKPIRTNEPVRSGQTISLMLPPETPTTVMPQPAPFKVAYLDDFAVVLDKPAGLAVHPTLNYPDHTLANGWVYYLQQQGKSGVFRPVNRLDKNTSGLVLCAQNAFAAPALAASAQKCYLAIVQGELPDGWNEIDAPIGRRDDSIIGRCVRLDGKPSVTRFRVLAAGQGYSLAACYPVTGRTHQIRVHMAYLGHPLAGDSLYGGSLENIGRHALHCAALRFAHPVTGQLVYTSSPLPSDMADFCRAYSWPSAFQAKELLP